MTALNSWLYRGNGRGRLEGQAPGGGRRRGLRGGKKRGPHLGRPWYRHLDQGILERAGREVGIWGWELRRKKSNKSYARIRGSCDARREMGQEFIVLVS